MAALVAAVVLPLLAGLIANHFVTKRSLKEAAIEKYRALSIEAARQVETAMIYAETNLRALAGNPLLADPDALNEDRLTEMGRIKQATQIFTDISLYDRNGVLLRSIADDYSDAVDRTDWFRRACDGTPTLSPPQPTLSREGLDISVYFPVDSKRGSETSVIKGRVPFDPVWNLLDKVQLGKGGLMVLVDGRRNVISHPDKAFILNKYVGPNPALIGAEEHGTYRDAGNQTWFWVSRVLPPDRTRVGEAWTLVALVPESEALAVASQSSLIQLAVASATLIGALALGFWLAHRLSSPLVAAAAAAHRVALGDLASRINHQSGPREITALAGAFNQMVEEVAQHRHRLEQLVKARTGSLQESQQRAEALSAQLRAAFESTREAILIVRPDGTIMAANGRFGQFFGLPALDLAGASFNVIEQEFFTCFADERAIRHKWGQTIGPDGVALEDEWEIRSPERRILASYTAPVTSSAGEVLGQLSAFSDLTRQRELQESLEQSQKMEAIGRLAGGVAHDFNNLLTAILGNLSLAETQLSRRETAHRSACRKHLLQARAAADRAAHLVKGLLGFSRRSHLHLTQCNINTVVRAFYPLIRGIIDPCIDIELELAPELWGVRADATKIEQILMNLCVNAKDAMNDRGRIIIRTAKEDVPASLARRFQAQPGQYVSISVSDNGSGIPDEIMGQIFEPFFTTKERGKGTGLGLATSYGIVQQHGGWIWCESRQGEGTTFRLYLPRNDKQELRVEAPPQRKLATRGTETLLLVDDEEGVRLVAETLLKSQGYRIIIAADGAEAVAKFEQYRDEIRMVLLDMSMPRMSGTEAYRQIRALDPAVPVIICSGYLVDLEEFKIASVTRPTGFVQKPYDFQDLLCTVRSILDAYNLQRSANRSPLEVVPALAG
ncbi:MAG: ATP-binding protein [Verrucomicrobiales bacterium]